jgi:hypothetical protein
MVKLITSLLQRWIDTFGRTQAAKPQFRSSVKKLLPEIEN